MVVFPFFHPYVSFFFFSCFFCTTYIYPYISSSPFFFLSNFHLIPEAPSLFLSPALSFSTLFLFFFYHYLQTHTNTHGEKGEIALAPPNRHCCYSTTHIRLYFFFLIFYCCSNFFFFFSVLDLLLLLF